MSVDALSAVPAIGDKVTCTFITGKVGTLVELPPPGWADGWATVEWEEDGSRDRMRIEYLRGTS